MHALLSACYSGGSEAIKPLDPESPGCSPGEHTGERLQGPAVTSFTADRTNDRLSFLQLYQTISQGPPSLQEEPHSLLAAGRRPRWLRTRQGLATMLGFTEFAITTVVSGPLLSRSGVRPSPLTTLCRSCPHIQREEDGLFFFHFSFSPRHIDSEL